MAQRIAVQLWPSLRCVAPGSREDLNGLDAWDGQVSIQIKGDLGIRDRIFHEIFKRDGFWGSFGPGSGPWRRSPSSAREYIFVGRSVALRATLDLLVRAEEARRLVKLYPNGSSTPTAMGFLLPIRQLVALGAEERAHALWSMVHA